MSLTTHQGRLLRLRGHAPALRDPPVALRPQPSLIPYQNVPRDVLPSVLRVGTAETQSSEHRDGRPHPTSVTRLDHVATSPSIRIQSGHLQQVRGVPPTDRCVWFYFAAHCCAVSSELQVQMGGATHPLFHTEAALWHLSHSTALQWNTIRSSTEATRR